jgi:hypothetical protein
MGVLGELSLPQRPIEYVEHMGVDCRAHCFHEVARERGSARRVGVQDPDARV